MSVVISFGFAWLASPGWLFHAGAAFWLPSFVISMSFLLEFVLDGLGWLFHAGAAFWLTHLYDIRWHFLWNLFLDGLGCAAENSRISEV